jgi:hypothetical protein
MPRTTKRAKPPIAAVFPQVRHVAVRAPGLRELFVSLARDSRARRATANREVIS